MFCTVVIHVPAVVRVKGSEVIVWAALPAVCSEFMFRCLMSGSCNEQPLTEMTLLSVSLSFTHCNQLVYHTDVLLSTEMKVCLTCVCFLLSWMWSLPTWTVVRWPFPSVSTSPCCLNRSFSRHRLCWQWWELQPKQWTHTHTHTHLYWVQEPFFFINKFPSGA